MNIFLALALKVSLLIVCAGSVDLFLIRASAAARHLLWTLTFAACLALPLTTWFLPPLRVMPHWVMPQSVATPVVMPAIAPSTPLRMERPAPAPAIPAPLGGRPVISSVKQDHSSPTTSPQSFFSWLEASYVAGVLLFLFPIACGPLIRRRLLRASQPVVQGDMLETFRAIQQSLHMRRTVLLRQSQHAIPLTVGFFRPLIILPHTASQWPQDKLKMVLLHELAHIHRYDAATQLLSRLVCALYWCNPLAGLAAGRMAALRERAADDFVLLHGARSSAYAATLLQFALERQGTWPAFSPAMQMARGSAQGRAFESRLRAVLSERAPRTFSQRLAILLALLALCLLLPVAALAVHNQPPAREQTDQLTQIRQDIWILRQNVIWSRPEETYTAARGLIQIGKPAVPELCAELAHHPPDQAVRVIAFTLRNIGDPRAIPSLTDALAETPIMASDCGDNMLDRDLWQFVTSHTLSYDPAIPSEAVTYKFPEFNVPRSDREIIAALQTLTGVSVSDRKVYVAPDDRPDHLQAAKDLRQQDIALWKQWWTMHSRNLVTPESMAQIQPWPADEDPVHTAGAAKFGELFPTGKSARLGPVHDVFFEQRGEMDSRMAIDFDTGRTFMQDEGMTAAELSTSHFLIWWRRMGIDAIAQSSVVNSGSTDPAKPEHFAFMLSGAELRVWQIANQRWDSFDAEIASGKQIDTGKFGASSQILNRDPETHELLSWNTYPLTYLFWAREGSRGILQIVDSPDQPPGLKIRYRLYEGLSVRQVNLPPAFVAPGNFVFDKPIELTLPSPQSGQPSILNLATGKLQTLTARPAIPALQRLADAMTGAYEVPADTVDKDQQAAAVAGGGDVVPQPEAKGALWCLATFDMRIGTVGRDAWEKFTPAQVAEVLSRCNPNSLGGGRNYMEIADASNRYPYQTGVYVFQTRDGSRGLLRIISGADKPQALTFEYKLLNPGG